jgi:hypothetical protein
MFIRDHIRNAYVKGLELTIDDLLALLPAELRDNRTRIVSNINTLCAEKKLKRVSPGITAIDKWPTKSERAPRGRAPKARRPKSVKDIPSRIITPLGMAEEGQRGRPRLDAAAKIAGTKPITVAGFDLVPLDDGRLLINDRERRTLCACLPEPVVRRIAELAGADD